MPLSLSTLARRTWRWVPPRGGWEERNTHCAHPSNSPPPPLPQEILALAAETGMATESHAAAEPSPAPAVSSFAVPPSAPSEAVAQDAAPLIDDNDPDTPLFVWLDEQVRRQSAAAAVWGSTGPFTLDMDSADRLSILCGVHSLAP